MIRLLLILLFTISSFTAQADPIMDRINKTGTIRCGYVDGVPMSWKDLKTGGMKGYTIDIMEEAGRRMALDIDWSYDTNWPTFITDMKGGKFDMLCAAYWANPKTSRFTLETIPLFYQPSFFLKRLDDDRFNTDFEKINDPSVTISVLDGDVPETVVEQLFPKAKILALPQTTSFSQVFYEVASGRADLSIASKADIALFEESNPGKLTFIDKPVRLYASAMQLPSEATTLKNALDVTFREMHLDGTIRRILETYQMDPDEYYFIDHPYSKNKATQK